jgi:ribonuclease P protein component
MIADNDQGRDTRQGVPLLHWVSLKRRADFKAASAGFRFSTSGFTLLRKPGPGEGGSIRVGLTVTKKLGSAVIRNRIRRRLRAAIQRLAPLYRGPAMDLVVLARSGLLTMPFAAIEADLERAIRALSDKPEAGPVRKSG